MWQKISLHTKLLTFLWLTLGAASVMLLFSALALRGWFRADESADLKVARHNLILLHETLFHLQRVGEGRKSALNPLSEKRLELLASSKFLLNGDDLLRQPAAEGEIKNLLANFVKQYSVFNAEVDEMMRHLRSDGSELVPIWTENTESQPHLRFDKATAQKDDLLLLTQKVILKYEEKQDAADFNALFVLFALFAFQCALVIIIFFRSRQEVVKNLQKANRIASSLVRGETPKRIPNLRSDEIGQLLSSMNQLSEGLRKIADVADKMSLDNFDAPLQLRSNDDVLGKALITMQDSLKKVSDDDFSRAWTTQGIAKIGELLQTFKGDLEDFAYRLTSHLVEYLEAQQGGFFILKQENNGKEYLELFAAYAFGKQKYSEKRIEVGQSLLGQAVAEKQSLFLNNLPPSYLSISSGLGEASPASLLIVPLKSNQQILGAIEIASFKHFEPYQISFLEKVSENIASAVSAIQANITTQRLLEETQNYASQMQAQEETMRESMEQLATAQDDMKTIQDTLKRKENDLMATMNNAEASIFSVDKEYKIKVFNINSKENFFVKNVNFYIGMDLLEIMTEEDRYRWKKRLDDAFLGKRTRMIDNYKGKDYSDNYYEIMVNPIVKESDKTIEGASIFVSEITDLRPIRWDDKIAAKL